MRDVRMPQISILTYFEITLQRGLPVRIGERDEAVLEHYRELNLDLLTRMMEYVSSWSRGS